MTRAEDNANFVAAFQRSRGLEVDSWAGPATFAALEALLGPLPGHPEPVTALPPPTPPVLPPLVFSGNAGFIVMPRLAWDNSGASRLGKAVPSDKRTSVIVHHTVTIDSDSTPNLWESEAEVIAHMRRLRTIRAGDLGADIPYNFVAFCMNDGKLLLAEGRGLDRSGAHTPGRNTSGIGIAFAGNFEKTREPGGMPAYCSLLGLFLEVVRKNGFPRLGEDRPSDGRLVWGHRDTKATACPGAWLYENLKYVRFGARA